MVLVYILYRGQYQVVIVAIDRKGNIATCQFTITVSPFECHSLDQPINGNATFFSPSTRTDAKMVARLNCDDRYLFPDLVPVFYTCDIMVSLCVSVSFLWLIIGSMESSLLRCTEIFIACLCSDNQSPSDTQRNDSCRQRWLFNGGDNREKSPGCHRHREWTIRWRILWREWLQQGITSAYLGMWK